MDGDEELNGARAPDGTGPAETELKISRETDKLRALDASPALDLLEAKRRLLEAAQLLGLEAGVAPAELTPAEPDRLEAWLARGDHATMGYMAEAPRARARAETVLPGARSVLVVALPYPPERDPLAQGPIASYARGDDYHRVLGRRLEALARFARSLLPGVGARRFVDTAPLLERGYAVAAGLGFSGKNTLVIHPKLGSYFFIGGIVLDRALPPDAPLDDAVSCGSCTRCLEACPTDAFPEAHQLDSRRCISYLTIEHRGAFDAKLRPLVGTRVFGCDVCQAVCPWNEKFAPPGDAALAPRPELSPRPLLALLEDARRSFKGLSHDTSLTRALKRGFLRNLATALGNSPRGAPASASPNSTGESLETLALEELSRDSDAGVREHALWALQHRQRDQSNDAPATGS